MGRVRGFLSEHKKALLISGLLFVTIVSVFLTTPIWVPFLQDGKKKVETYLAQQREQEEKAFYSEFEKSERFEPYSKPYVVDNGQGLAFIYIGRYREENAGNLFQHASHIKRLEAFFAYWQKQYPINAHKIRNLSSTSHYNLYVVLYGP